MSKGSAPWAMFPRSCPEGFAWDGGKGRCVPTADASPMVNVIGECERVEYYPSYPAFVARYVRPAVLELAGAIDAQPQQEDPDSLVGSEVMPVEVVLHVVASQAPVAFGGVGSDRFGLLCELPLSDQLGPEPAAHGDLPASQRLIDDLANPVRDAILEFNQTGTIKQIPVA